MEITGARVKKRGVQENEDSTKKDTLLFEKNARIYSKMMLEEINVPVSLANQE